MNDAAGAGARRGALGVSIDPWLRGVGPGSERDHRAASAVLGTILPVLTALAMVRALAYPGLAGRLFAGTVLVVSLALAVTTLCPRRRR